MWFWINGNAWYWFDILPVKGSNQVIFQFHHQTSVCVLPSFHFQQDKYPKFRHECDKSLAQNPVHCVRIVIQQVVWLPHHDALDHQQQYEATFLGSFQDHPSHKLPILMPRWWHLVALISTSCWQSHLVNMIVNGRIFLNKKYRWLVHRLQADNNHNNWQNIQRHYSEKCLKFTIQLSCQSLIMWPWWWQDDRTRQSPLPWCRFYQNPSHPTKVDHACPLQHLLQARRWLLADRPMAQKSVTISNAWLEICVPETFTPVSWAFLGILRASWLVCRSALVVSGSRIMDFFFFFKQLN